MSNGSSSSGARCAMACVVIIAAVAVVALVNVLQVCSVDVLVACKPSLSEQSSLK